MGPVTGRLSCWLMTLPRYGDDLEEQVRAMYIAGPSRGKARLVAQIHDAAIVEMDGYFIYFDLSQAEARLAAYFSGDEYLIEACKQDIHTANAMVIFGGIPEAAVRIARANELSPYLDHSGKPLKWKAVSKKLGGCKEERDISKSCGFCVWYEGTAERAFTTLRAAGKEASLAACEELVRRFHNRYKRYYQYIDENEAYVRKHGHLRTVLLGRIYWIGWHAKRTEIANFPIQSGIADLQNERLPEIEDRLPSCKDPQDVKKLIEEVWSRPVKVPHNGLSFVMPTEVKIGKSWKDFG
jgi:DNA polymerase I-like protein with 3'-5' exonuclease and polymerase domains